MKKIAVFASGNGSNFQALIDASKSSMLDAEIALLICDNENAYAIERAKQNKIDYYVFNHNDFSKKSEYENKIIELLVAKKVSPSLSNSLIT